MTEQSTAAGSLAAHVCLIGMMGVGKTTVGRLLAQRLGRPFADTDQQVCAAAGRSVTEIFATDGEAAFRTVEAQALQGAMASQTASVISAGGGAVLDPSSRWLLGRGGPVVWLRADPETLVARLGGPAGRPLLLALPPGPVPGVLALESLRQLDQERRPIYAGLADISVDVEGLDAEGVAEQVLVALGARSRGR